MATIITKIMLWVLMVIAASHSFAHTIYAPNDIPLLDNRFRIDPYTEQVTFILNHSKGPQIIVLVRPDGSKLYYQDHPESVSWVAASKLDIITIANPMPGPWQAIADLDGDNRIKLLSSISLKTNKLPIKLYTNEYITTQASLYHNEQIMTDANYLSGARLSVALIGENQRQLTLYKDDGRNYDQLPFDGSLTARMFINIKPGRYLLSVRTKNDVFMRSQNQDAVVFPTPISYEISQLDYGSEQAKFIFKIDQDELDTQSISIDGTIKDANNRVLTKVIIHGSEDLATDRTLTKIQKVAYGDFIFSGKAYATTLSGREVELKLPELKFWLRKKVVMPTIEISAAVTTDAIEQPPSSSLWENIWVIIAIAFSSLILIVAIVFIIIRRKRRKQLADTSDQLSLDELANSELQPEAIDLSAPKK